MPRDSKFPVPTAQDINEAHQLAKSCAETAVQHAIKCGQLLTAKKADMPRGEFDLWVEKNCAFGRSSAYVYMQVSGKSSRGLDDLKSIQQALGYDKPKAKPVTPEPQVMNPPESAAQDSVAGNQHKAHVMGIGAVHRAAETRPVEAAPPSSPEPERWEPEENEAANIEQAEKEYTASIDKVMAADDKLAAAHAEIKRQAAEIASLKLSRNGYQNQCSELIRRIKALQRENDKLKRQAA